MGKLLRVVIAIVLVTTLKTLASEEKIKLAAVQLNDTVQKADTKALLPSVTRILKVQMVLAEKMMLSSGLTLGDLACATLLSEKTGKTVEEIVIAHPDRDWAKGLTEAKVNLDEAFQFLDNINTEFAFASLDTPKKKKK